MRSRLLRNIGVVVAGVTASALVLTPAQAEDPVGKYGDNDGGGFLNVLPPGSNGVDTAADFAAYASTGVLPEHWADQQPLYEGLLYASPTLTNSQISDYFKDATFGVRKSDVESRITPRPGATIIRDEGYGVPHIYGETRGDTMFGAGYAGAADRLFLMDVLRNTGRATLSSFLGGGNLGADEEQWRFAPYTEADLKQQMTLMKQGYGKAGKKAVKDVKNYVAGVNEYIDLARSDADLMPVEYALIGKELKDWKVTDVIATASLVGGIFGKGGGREMDSSLILRALQNRFGKDEGRQIWSGFRFKNEPDAPVTVKDSFPYQDTDPFAKKGLALPERGSYESAEVVSDGSESAFKRPAPSGVGTQIRDALRNSHASNWEIVAAKNSRNGRPLAVMGPQVGYWIPQILMEMDLHGPGIDARGAAFAGVNLYVQMGHGRDYAWSATSAGSDNVDTFAEVLCGGDKFHYKYKGKCRPMEKLVRENSWEPNAIDPTPAGSATLTVYRTAHGIVTGYGKAKGKRVAYAIARTTYMHEADSVIGFAKFNDPGVVDGPEGFQKAASKILFTFNWAYADAKHTAYYLSGAYPRRAEGTSADFPVFGTGEYDWAGYDHKTWTQDEIGFDRHPQAIDQGVTVSWNNKPATDWSAADEQWGYGPMYRSQMIADRIRAHTKGKKTITKAQLVQAMEEPATQDIRGLVLLPVLLDAVGSPSDPELQDALKKLRRWHNDGAHRRDLDKDGVYEHNPAIEIMDAWWPALIDAQFRDGLGKKSFKRIQAMIGIGADVRHNPSAPGFSDGWWGYVDRDLRALFDGDSQDLGTIFCGNGDRKQCRQDLRGALGTALTVTPVEMYGYGKCADNPQPSCFDRNGQRVTAAIGKPDPFPFQNRPTFQQVVNVEKVIKNRD